MNKKKMRVCFVGLAGVPYLNRAIDVRLNSLVDIFSSLGYRVEIINRFSRRTLNTSFKTRAQIHEIIPSRSCSNRISFLFFFILSLIIEPFYILKISLQLHIDVLYVTTGHFTDRFFYWILSKLIRSKLVIEYNEYRSAFDSHNLYHKLNGFLQDRVAPKFADAAICISHFIKENCEKVNPIIKTCLIYPICDFSFFDKIENSDYGYKYILFCGSVGYIEVIQFIISSYNKSKLADNIKLVLVLNGRQDMIDKIREENPQIEILIRLPYDELIRRYKSALALLIPLRNNIRDKARYPNKICEYCASKGVIVTTNNGEIPYTFKDMVNALIANSFDINDYVEKLNWIYENLDKLSEIRDKAYQTGKKYFYFESYNNTVEKFLRSLF